MGSRDQQGTKDCTAVVAVLSSALQESTHVATELSLALDYKRPIIPVLREPWEPAEHSEHTHRLKFLLAGRRSISRRLGSTRASRPWPERSPRHAIARSWSSHASRRSAGAFSIGFSPGGL